MATQGGSASASALPTLEIPSDCRDAAKRWRVWRQKFQSHLLVSGLSDKDEEIQIAALITCLDSDALEVFNTLQFEKEGDAKKIKEILKLMEQHYVAEINVVYERFLFFRRSQQKEESFENFLTAIRALASTCDFKAMKDEMIRDRIVCGIASPAIQRQLLQAKDLKLADCIAKCRTAETTATYQERMSAGHTPSGTETERHPPLTEVCAIRRKPSLEKGRNNNMACSYCGRRHRRRECPAFGMTCRRCGKKNHFEACCQSFSVRMSNYYMDVGNPEAGHAETADDANAGGPRVNNMTCKKLRDKITTTLLVDEEPVQFQIDSGATCDVVRLDDLSEKAARKLKPSAETLRLYDESRLNTLGRCQAQLRNPKTGRCQEANFIVVKEAPTAILGAETSQKMGLITVHYEQLYTATAQPPKLDARKQLVERFQKVFSEELGEFEGEIHLEVDLSKPAVQTPLRKIPLAVQERVEAELQRLQTLGVLEKVTSPSDWISSMIATEKKGSEKIRLCIDPKPLNQALKRSKYPLPTFEDVLPKLANAKVFSVCDLRNGFWHCKLDEESSMLTTFATPYGRFRWTRLPFGVAPAPEIFQRKLTEQLEGLPGITMIAEDVLVYGQGDTEEEALADHDRNLELLLWRAEERGIRMNEGKFKYRLPEVTYAGHILSRQGVKVDPKKTEAVCGMAPPKDVAELRRFLGMANFLGKFVKDMAETCEPLRQLTREDVQWQWAHEHARAFDSVKKKIASAPVLTFFNPKQPLAVQCDASQHALGAALLQQGGVIAYASRSLTETERAYAQIEKELLAVVFAVEKFDHYVYGRQVQVDTDHKPLIPIMKKPIQQAPKRLQRMLLRLQRYDTTLQYRKGADMHIADTLSRAPMEQAQQGQSGFEKELETVCAVTSDVEDRQLEDIRRETRKDPTLQAVAKLVRDGWPSDKRSVEGAAVPYFNIRDELVIDNDVLFKGNRCIVPASLRKQMLHKLHQAHMGVESCLRRARESIFWPGVNQQIKDFVQQCDSCQTFGPQQQKETLIPHQIVDKPWAKVGADLFSFKGKEFLITVDYHSNYWEIDCLNKDASSFNVINKLRAQFARYGVPRTVFTDNGPQFASTAFTEFATEWGFQHCTSSPEYPQSNGKAESAVKTAKSIMRRAAHAGTDGWLAILAYRDTPTEGMGTSPAQRFLQRRLRTTLPVTNDQLKPSIAEDTTERLKKRQQRQEKYYNRSAKDLPAIPIGARCRVYRHGRWQTADVLQRVGPGGRSYIVRTNDGGTFRRNRMCIKEHYDPVPFDEQPASIREEREDSEEEDIEELMPEATQPQTARNETRTRSGRVSRQPAYLSQYDTS